MRFVFKLNAVILLNIFLKINYFISGFLFLYIYVLGILKKKKQNKTKQNKKTSFDFLRKVSENTRSVNILNSSVSFRKMVGD